MIGIKMKTLLRQLFNDDYTGTELFIEKKHNELYAFGYGGNEIGYDFFDVICFCLQGKKWFELTEKDLMRLPSVAVLMTFLAPVGFFYYLPAYLHMHMSLSDNANPEELKDALVPETYKSYERVVRKNRAKWWKEYIALFNVQQKTFILYYMQLQKDRYQNYENSYIYDDILAFWKSVESGEIILK